MQGAATQAMWDPRDAVARGIVEERQRCLYAPWPPRPAGLRLPRPANYCGLPVVIQLGMGAATKCQIILARALSVFAVACGRRYHEVAKTRRIALEKGVQLEVGVRLQRLQVAAGCAQKTDK